MAFRLSTGRAAVCDLKDCPSFLICVGRGGGVDFGSRQLDDKFGAGQLYGEAQVLQSSEAKVDVVPGYGGVPSRCCRGARNDSGVGMAFHYFAPGSEGDVVEGVRELAYPAANGGDEATFLELAPSDETSSSCCWTKLSPKAEEMSARDFGRVERAGGDA